MPLNVDETRVNRIYRIYRLDVLNEVGRTGLNDVPTDDSIWKIDKELCP